MLWRRQWHLSIEQFGADLLAHGFIPHAGVEPVSCQAWWCVHTVRSWHRASTTSTMELQPSLLQKSKVGDTVLSGSARSPP